MKKKTNITENQITEMGESRFVVLSEKDPHIFYLVDMVSGLCECKAGLNCSPCKHNDAIAKYHNIS